MPSQRQKKILPPLNSYEEVARVLVEMSSEYSNQRQVSFEVYMSELCNDPSGQGGVYLVKLLRTHSLSFENIVDLRNRFVPSFSNMEWKHATQLWPQYKYHTSIPEFNPIEPYIPKSFATEVFRAIEEAEVDTCPLNAATNEAKVVAWMRAILVKISNFFNGTITNDAEGFIRGMGASKGCIEFIYMVLELCVIVVLEAKCGGIARNNYAQMMTELEGCDMQNVSCGLHLDILHGVLASQSEWYFWTYDGQGFQVSEVIVPFHRNEKQEVLNRLRITSRLLGQFLNGYCSALCAFIQRSEEVGLQQRQEQRCSSHQKWQEASVLAEQAKVKALSAKNEEDFAVFKCLLNQSFDALPEEHQPQLRFPTRSNIIEECIAELQH